MLTNHNGKLGSKIWVFDLPAKMTCPGSTPLCRSLCYATGGRFRMNAIKRRQQACWDASKKEEFPAIMIGMLEGVNAKTVRIHGAGDFYSVDYAKKWLKVMQALPDVTFYFYSRSWRKPEIRKVLIAMSKLSNVYAWFSADKDASPTKKQLGSRVRVAYLQATEDDIPTQLSNLVFRTHKLRTTVAKTVANKKGKAIEVCATEQGGEKDKKLTCSVCKVCFSPSKGSVTRFELPMLQI